LAGRKVARRLGGDRASTQLRLASMVTHAQPDHKPRHSPEYSAKLLGRLKADDNPPLQTAGLSSSGSVGRKITNTFALYPIHPALKTGLTSSPSATHRRVDYRQQSRLAGMSGPVRSPDLGLGRSRSILSQRPDHPKRISLAAHWQNRPCNRISIARAGGHCECFDLFRIFCT